MTSLEQKSIIQIVNKPGFCIFLHESKSYLPKIIPCKISYDEPNDSFMTINKLVIEAMKITNYGVHVDENKTNVQNTNGGTLGPCK